MKARSLLVLALAGVSFWAPGCSGGGVHAPIRIELAPTLDCAQETADFPSDLRFFTLQICPSMGGDCAMLTDPSGDHGGGSTELRITRTLDRRFTVDARVDASMDYDVTVVGYSGAETGTCMPYALGHALGVRFGGPVQVRLYPLGGWSCAGTHEGDNASVTRALHQAVLLPNHEVLLLGGIQGPRAGAVAFATPTGAQTTTEVFDPRDARFHTVTMNDENGNPGFSRVMFQDRYIGTNADGMYEIHTYGGFDIQHTAEAALGFDANANATSSSALFGPLSLMMMGQAAGFRSDTVILYDPRTRTATTTAHDVGTYTATAATDGAGSIAVVRSIDSVMVSGGRPSYQFSAGWQIDGGAQGTLLANRLGASITPLSANSFLIWGGHVSLSSEMALATTDVIPLSGELVSTMSPSMPVMVGGHDPAVTPDDGLPFPTAYHTATHIAGPTGSTAILFAGGLILQGGAAPLGNAVGPSPTLTVSRFSGAGAIVGGDRVTGRTNTVLHTANAVDASATSVLLVGGASQMTTGGISTTLYGERGAGTVDYASAAGTYTWNALPSLITGRWGHTTTIIPDHGVLVVGGVARADASLTVLDNAELLLWEDLRGTGRPASMSCAMPTDAGTPSGDGGARDAGPHDAGTMVDTGAAMTPDTGVDGG